MAKIVFEGPGNIAEKKRLEILIFSIFYCFPHNVFQKQCSLRSLKTLDFETKDNMEILIWLAIREK